MAKPPPATPHSDLDGVHRDRRRIDAPENAHPDPGKRLDRDEKESKGRPESSARRRAQ